jgi:hypothetical protein
MARARNIKPGFFTNDDLVELDFATRLLFAGLWTVADREGRLEDRPKKIKIAIFPADDVDMEAMLGQLASRGFIQRYSVAGQALIQINKWDLHQNPHHTEKASVLPPLPNGDLTVKGQEPDGGNPADSLIPDSGFTDSPIQEPSDPPPAEDGPTRAKPVKGKPKEPPVSGPTWDAYKSAYLRRYGAEPVRNATVNGQLAQLVGRLGAEESPHVAAFFVGHKDAFYVKGAHSVGLLLRDAEKLRMEWVTGRQVSTVPAEPAWRIEQRERTQQAAPGVAARHQDAADFFIDAEVKRVTAN